MSNDDKINEIYNELIKPLPLRWRAKQSTQRGAIIIPYVDSRDVQHRLDEVLGPLGWENNFYEACGQLFCRITIHVEGVSVSKCDTGSEANTEKEKSKASDAFKRAAVHFGINRNAYELEPIKLKTKEFRNKWYPVDEDGKFLKGDALNDYCNAQL